MLTCLSEYWKIGFSARRHLLLEVGKEFAGNLLRARNNSILDRFNHKRRGHLVRYLQLTGTPAK